MIGSSCDSMKHKREFDTCYFHNHHVQGVNYSLFIMLLKKMVSMESKRQPWADLAVSPLLSSQSADLYSVFHVSPSPHHEVPKGGVYIIGFRSIRVCRFQDGIETTHEAKVGSHHAARVVSRVVGPLLVLVASPVNFFSRSSISRKNNVAKSLGPFDVRKVPESKKHVKTRKYASRF
jgi:hypothetical protein